MKKIFYIIVLTFLFAFCEQQKIAYVNNSKVINEYQEKLDIEGRYKVKIDAYNKRKDSLGKSLQLEYQSFQVNSKQMSKENAQSKYDELLQKQQLLQQQFQFEEQQIAQQSQTEIDSLIIKVKAYIENYGKENKYTYILGTSDGASSVLYVTDENDLSETILEALNNSYKKE